MKRIIICIFCFAALLFSNAYANELEFTPVGGGKFIYCNNPEGIEDDMVLNGANPRWIMNNEKLTPDMYHIYLSHFNYTGNGALGYDIELDMAMTAREDSKITIHKAFFETPYEYSYYSNGGYQTAESDWGMLSVCSNMLDIPICDIRGNDIYYPWGFEPVTLEIKKGDRIWLSDYIGNYQRVHFGMGVHIQALVEIESGEMDFNVGAIKSGGFLRYRQNIPKDAAFGEYRWDYTLKGIADTLPEVTCDIEYTINNDTKDGEKIPVLLKNQYIPEGHTVTEWYTQLNPQNDIWSKTSAAESDILPLYYKDDTKLEFYGSAAEEKDNVWVFDTLHSAVRKYETRFNTGAEEDFAPNFLLDTDTDNHAYACNIGNYGVATTYNMRVENTTDKPKYCTLAITAAGTVIAYETSENGEKSYGYVKDLTGEKVTDNMLSHKIEPNSVDSFKFTIVLPVNYNGGIKNEIIISDNNIQSVDFEAKKAEIGENAFRRDDTFSGRYITEVFPLLPEETAAKVWEHKDSYEYLRGRDSAIIRWCAWDGAPEWYYNLWEHVSTIYAVDKDYNITGEHTFPSLPCGASWNDGYFYVKTARDGVFKSADGIVWNKTDEDLPSYAPYYDLERASDWAIPELERGWELGLRLTWYGESYNFKSGMSREGFCLLASKLLDRLNLAQNPLADIRFDDTDNPQIERLSAIGVINGFGDGTFRPSEQITREQAAVILSRLYSYIENGNTHTIEGEEHIYSDNGDISDWAKAGVNFAYNMGIMHGVGENRFEPQGSYSVEQSGVTMVRLYDCVINGN